jgi:regulation of enolase protein 1 (concanavalin A-like superfamily)
VSKKFLFRLCLGLGVIALTSTGAFASAIDIRIATGSDDVEEYVSGHDMYLDSSDLEMPYEDSVGAGDEQVIGLRFAVPIPKGAKVTKAYVEFTCDETKSGTLPVNLIIQGQFAPNAPAFGSATADATSRTPTKAQVKWAVENWTASGQKSQTADISAIIQEIIDQANWKGGNTLVLLFSDDKSNPSKGIRCADAIEDGATGPLLHIEIFNPAASAPNPADGAVGVTMPLLGWTKGDGAIFHNAYFGKTPDLTEADVVAKNQPFPMYYHVAGLEVGTTYYWRVDEIDMTGKVTPGAVWSFASEPIAAYAPKPANGAADLFPAATLSWLPGKLALQHQVFFGTNLADVTDGKPAADKGKVTDPKFNPGALRASTTYYWRVDEILANGTVNKGPVWSFTTADGIAKKIVSQWWFNITGGSVTNLTSNANYPDNPTGTELRDDFQGYGENQYDYYGMRVYGWLNPPQSGDYTFWIAANDAGECWLSTDADPANAKMICSVPNGSGGDPRQWDGDTAQKSAPITLQAGQKYFIMALQKDGTGRDHVAVAWQGPGIGGQAVISSQYVDTFGLPPLTAFSPTPANAAAEAPQNGKLTWNAGDKAQKHDVYFGEDKAAVAAADTKSPLYKGQQADATLSAGDLEWGKTYFWRVDEIDAAGAINAGPVWSFTTANFLPVDDMESYTDEEGSRIYETWVDGWTNNTGAVVGNLTAPFAERTTIHGGKQAMPMDFNNTKTPFYSEAEQTFSPLQNWTTNGVDTLSLWVHGNPVAFVDKGNGAFTVGASGHDIWDDADDFRFVYKKLNGNGSITVKVESLVNTNAWAKAGVMIRDSLDAGSQMAYVIQSFSSGVSFGWRQTMGLGCASADASGIVAPQWVKLTRTGNAFTAQYSADGKTWTDVKTASGTAASTTLGIGANYYIGLCVTSHNTAATTTAELSGATTTGGVTGSWQQVWIGDDPDRTNGAGNLYVAVEDSTGKVAVASDPALVNASDWTEWKIPLSSFAGVNLAKVKKLYIGVGDRKNPAADGAGRIYVDDIRVTKP